MKISKALVERLNLLERMKDNDECMIDIWRNSITPSISKIQKEKYSAMAMARAEAIDECIKILTNDKTFEEFLSIYNEYG